MDGRPGVDGKLRAASGTFRASGSRIKQVNIVSKREGPAARF